MKKIKTRYLVLLGFAFLGLSYYVLGNMQTDININSLITADVLLGLGYGIIAGPANVMAAADFKGKLLTASQSVANVLRQIGLVLATAIFVSLLTTNVNNAKDNISNYASTQINNSSLPNSFKDKAIDKIQHTLKTSSNTTISTNKIKPKKISLSNNQLNIKAHQQVEVALQKQGPLPPKVKQALYPKMMKIAKNKIKQKVQQTNQEIESLTSKIKHHAKEQLVDAFLQIYRVMMPIALISMLSGLLFKNTKQKL
ncbi:hypothetical protein [Bombilactobacillus bombi]|uniref:hypothetical protein n=1 Tax=Bombilactobacillus bombi TaxID=1303590 RepID=UPI0015E5ACF6|nr:hypothetical protein [Bombilactobacillus bombi]MBA1435164.1 MFS transporter [Bombilactobacillus bombi]